MTSPSVLAIPEALAERRFARMVVVACRAQLDGLTGDDILVVSTDWLAWRQAAEAGLPALHVEAGLDGAGDPRWEEDRYIAALDWTRVDGPDVTLFKGVSLGHQFTREVGHACHYYCRLRDALARLAARFGVETIELRGLEPDYALFDDQSRRWVAEDAAAAAGAGLDDRLAPAAAAELPTTRMVVAPPGPPDMLRSLWGKAVDLLSRLRWRLAGRPDKILILPSLLMLRPMVAAFDRADGVMPVLLSDRYPKRPGFAFDVLRRGLALVEFPTLGLDAAERAEVDGIVARLRAAWSAEAIGEHRFLRAYVLEQIIASGRFHAMARRIKQWHVLFTRHRFRRVLCTDSTNYESRIPLELARARGIPGDELVNGMFNTHHRHDGRCGTGATPPLLSRFLAWGQQNVDWLDEIRAPLPSIVTGYPVLDPLRAQARPAAGRRRALVLACPPCPDDLVALRGDGYKYAVDVLRMLAEEGWETRFKLHPGLERAEYYEAVFARYGIKTQILKTAPIHPLMQWADVVVGPITSGAMAEALALGRPYFPVLAPPSSVTAGGRAALPVCADADELRRRLAEPVDVAAALERLAACGSIPSAADRVWRALTAGIGKDRK